MSNQFTKIAKHQCINIASTAIDLLRPNAPANLSSIAILCYHRFLPERFDADDGILSIPEDQFDSHMRFLSETDTRTLSLEEFEAIASGRSALTGRAVLITIDDGYEDSARIAIPIAERYGITVNLFILTDESGKAFGPMEGHSHGSVQASIQRNPELWKMLDWKTLKQLNRRGVGIGLHGRTHVPLSSLDDMELPKEIESAVRVFTENMDFPPTAFALPYGSPDSYTIETLRVLQANGLRSIFSTHPARCRLPVEHLPVNRFVIEQSHTVVQVNQMVSGSMDWIGNFKRMAGRWLNRPISTLSTQGALPQTKSVFHNKSTPGRSRAGTTASDDQQKCSILIPACNEGDRIAHLLEQLTTDCPGFVSEIVVCANGCTDNTAEVVQQWQRVCPLIHLITLDTASKPAAWNALVSCSIESVVICLDADVVPLDGCIRGLMRAVNQSEHIIYGGKRKYHRARDSWNDVLIRLLHEPVLELSLVGGCYAFRKPQLLERLSHYDYKSMPDVFAEDLFIQSLLEKHELTILQDCVVEVSQYSIHTFAAIRARRLVIRHELTNSYSAEGLRLQAAFPDTLSDIAQIRMVVNGHYPPSQKITWFLSGCIKWALTMTFKRRIDNLAINFLDYYQRFGGSQLLSKYASTSLRDVGSDQ